MNRRVWPNTQMHDPARIQSCMQPESQLGWTSDSMELAMAADGFDPISLKEMDEVALLNRVDIKFMLNESRLLDVLTALQSDYWILSVNGKRMNHYRTLYFDTPDFALYRLHVNDRAERYKVRSREYTDTRTSFLEVKHKTRKDRTIKERISTSSQMRELTPEAEAWLDVIYPYDCQTLQPTLWNSFTRITLVSKHLCERVTLDTNISFYASERSVDLNGLAIAEVKRDASYASSPFLEQMRAQRLHPRGFSKYCMGVSMLFDQVKKNILKPKLLKIEKMIGGIHYE